MSNHQHSRAALALAVPLVAHGQATYEPARWYDDRWYLTPFGSYILSGGERISGDGWAEVSRSAPDPPELEPRARGMRGAQSESNGPGKYKN
jgi:OOP family OmpA-OmpF porin